MLAVLVHDGVLMSCRALSIALSHTFYKRTQSTAHQVQPLRFVVIEQGLEAFIHCLSACIIIYMCGLRILSLGFLEILFFSQAASHASKAATALRALASAVSLEMSLNQVLQPVQHAPDDWCAVCFEPLGGAAQDDADAASAAAATAAALGGCVRLPCNHCFHKVCILLSSQLPMPLPSYSRPPLPFLCPQHCMVAWLRKKAECPTCRASVWPVQANGILFHFLPSPAAVAVAGGGLTAGGGAAAPSPVALPQDPFTALPAAVVVALSLPQLLPSVAAASLPLVQLPAAPAAAAPIPSLDTNPAAALALIATPLIDSRPDCEPTAVPAGSAVCAAHATAPAAAAPISVDAAAVSALDGAPCAASARAEEWTTVSRRRRRLHSYEDA